MNMDNITSIVAMNLSSIRRDRQLTLQDLAALTGVSKSMLREIERGTSSPTINVLWKITTGLKIPISKLIQEPVPKYRVVREEEWRPPEGNAYDLSLIFDYDHTRNFEIYHIQFQPHKAHFAHSHEKGVVEYTMVYEGTMTIVVDGEPFVLNVGDSFFFDGDNPHSYHNHGDVSTKAYSLIYYPF